MGARTTHAAHSVSKRRPELKHRRVPHPSLSLSLSLDLDPEVLGFLDPAELLSGEASEKGDMYALGLILLQLLLGQPDVGSLHCQLATASERAAALSCNGGSPGGTDRLVAELMAQLDMSAGRWDLSLAEQALRVGLHCAGPEPEARPDLGRQVAPLLRSIAAAAAEERRRKEEAVKGRLKCSLTKVRDGAINSLDCGTHTCTLSNLGSSSYSMTGAIL